MRYYRKKSSVIGKPGILPCQADIFFLVSPEGTANKYSFRILSPPSLDIDQSELRKDAVHGGEVLPGKLLCKFP